MDANDFRSSDSDGNKVRGDGDNSNAVNVNCIEDGDKNLIKTCF